MVEKGVGNLPDKQKIIIDLIKKYPSITKKQIWEHENLSKKSIEYDIDKLKEMGVLRLVGPTKDGYWEIIEKDL